MTAKTVLMYLGAKEFKDQYDDDYRKAITEAQELAKPLRDPNASPNERSQAHADLTKSVEGRAHSSTIEASKAADEEQWRYGKSRGPDQLDQPGDDITRRPTDREIGAASGAQVAQLREMIMSRAFDREKGKTPDPNAPVNVNTATEEALCELHGIGPVTADAIIKEREKRRFDSPDDLTRVRGIGAGKLRLIRDRITV